MSQVEVSRRFAVGAEALGELGTHFRVWAPAASRVSVVERGRADDRRTREHPLRREPTGYFAALVAGLGAGAQYSFRLDDTNVLYPDPASRFQPDGPHGPSEIVDPTRYAWKETGFAGPPQRGQVIYELHVGTFTQEGTYLAAERELSRLAALGVTTIELLPLAEFPGDFGWGYDGVALWAPTHLYGPPDALRAFIDSAHAQRIAVILDVVYNHLGPDGNYLDRFASDYFTDRHANEWGKALNFDGPNSGPVREFFRENAAYWIDEYRLDGLRLDATQMIIDDSPRHVLAELTARARAAGRAQGRAVFVCAENEPQDPRFVADSAQGGYGCDALWNDDFHHTAVVAMTGRREAYYYDYTGSSQELISALKWGYLFQGQHYAWQRKRRGRPALAVEAHHFVSYLENHDQVANSLRGDRLSQLTSPATLRAMTALWLLSPPTPMLFQGQEYGTTVPFRYFADHRGELAERVRAGRREFVQQFQSVREGVADAELLAPHDRISFEQCKLHAGASDPHGSMWALHRDLLLLRKTDPAFCRQRAELVHGAVLGAKAFLLRFFCDEGDRLIVVNLGMDLVLEPAPEPLLAPPAGSDWHLLLSSEDAKYGGLGYRAPHTDGRWTLSASATYVLCAKDPT
jgi:maltooligosyltrehalose trehalohydrolase